MPYACARMGLVTRNQGTRLGLAVKEIPSAIPLSEIRLRIDAIELTGLC